MAQTRRHNVSTSQIILRHPCRAQTSQEFILTVRNFREVETLISRADDPGVVSGASVRRRHFIMLPVATKITYRVSQTFIGYNTTAFEEEGERCHCKSRIPLVNSAEGGRMSFSKIGSSSQLSRASVVIVYE